MSFLPKSLNKQQLHYNCLNLLRTALLSKNKVKEEPYNSVRLRNQINVVQEPAAKPFGEESEQEFSQGFDNTNIISFRDYLNENQLDARDTFSKFRYSCRYGELNADFYEHPDRYKCIYEDYQKVKLTEDLIEQLKELKRQNVLFYNIHIEKIKEVLYNCPYYVRCDKQSLECFVWNYFCPITITIDEPEKYVLFEEFKRLSFKFMFLSCYKLYTSYQLLRKIDGQSPLPQLFAKNLTDLLVSRNIINYFIKRIDFYELNVPVTAVNLDLIDEFLQREKIYIIEFLTKLYEYLETSLKIGKCGNDLCMPIFELRKEDYFINYYDALVRKCRRYYSYLRPMMSSIYDYYVIYHANRLLENYLIDDFNTCVDEGLITIATDWSEISLDVFDREKLVSFWRFYDSHLSYQLRQDLDISAHTLKRGLGIFTFQLLQKRLKNLMKDIIQEYDIYWRWLYIYPDSVIKDVVECFEGLDDPCKKLLQTNIRFYKC